MVAIGMIGISGCTSTSPEATRPLSAVTASRQTPAEVDATLATLHRIDKLPLYEMTYTGDYDGLAGVPGPGTPASPFGCSLFVASGDPNAPLFGRNFDWDPNPALVLHADPPDGYASVSIVDISYLGVKVPDSAEDKRKLLNAPLLPFDGMNERGLAVGLAADDSASVRPDPAKQTVGSVRVIRLILDHAATVDEAIALLGRYNLDFTGGPPLHYLLADATGASAVVEFVDGTMTVERGGPPWQALTNFRIAGTDDDARQRDHRYAVASGKLRAEGGKLDPATAMDLLHAVAQPHTRWSVTYELRTGKIRVVAGQRWQTVYDFSLPMKV